jgi:hypothetical protein
MALLLIGCENEYRYNPPIGQVLIKDLGDFIKPYGYRYVVGPKISKIADLCVERCVYNDKYGSISIEEFAKELKIYCLWNFGFNVDITFDNMVMTIEYGDSDEIYNKLPKI